MYTLNLLAFDQHLFLNRSRFDIYLKQLPVQVVPIPTDNFLQGQTLPPADINLFLCSSEILAHPQPYQRLHDFLSSGSPGVNLCLMPDSDSLENQLVAHFHDFLLWPCSATEFNTRLVRLLGLRKQSLTDPNQLLAEFASLNLIGKSPEFLHNVQLIKKISTCHAAVLIQGETGTGKENAARAIHYLSKRREQSFVPVNCAAIPDELLESELFGHEKGAFTDAKQSQAGLVTIANRGTLFLDEVDSLSPKAQAALLRFLQTQEYRPLGSKQTLHADVRILAATNADLKTLVANKQFREDLFFRLNVLNLVMPPLRERLDDIGLIADNLLHRFAIEYQTAPKQLSRSGLNYLMQLPWPGNIRELENSLLRAFLLSPGAFLEFSEVPVHFHNEPITIEASVTETSVQNNFPTNLGDARQLPTMSFQDAKAIAINEFEANYLKQVMHIAKGNVSAAARLAGKERRALGKLLQKYAIDKAQFQSIKEIPVNSLMNQATG